MLRGLADLATPKINTFKVIGQQPNELQNSQRVQIVAQLILFWSNAHFSRETKTMLLPKTGGHFGFSFLLEFSIFFLPIRDEKVSGTKNWRHQKCFWNLVFYLIKLPLLWNNSSENFEDQQITWPVASNPKNRYFV